MLTLKHFKGFHVFTKGVNYFFEYPMLQFKHSTILLLFTEYSVNNSFYNNVIETYSSNISN